MLMISWWSIPDFRKLDFKGEFEYVGAQFEIGMTFYSTVHIRANEYNWTTSINELSIVAFARLFQPCNSYLSALIWLS